VFLFVLFAVKLSSDAATVMAKNFQLNISRHQKHRNVFQFCYSSKNSMLENPIVQVREKKKRSKKM
jgi:hypothetical protein